MIYLVHGDDSLLSRRFLFRLKSGYDQVVDITGKNISKERLELALFSESLLAKKILVVVEDLKNWQEIKGVRLNNASDLVFWFKNKIDLPDFPINRVILFDLRQASAFKLADALLMKNEKLSFLTLSSLLKQGEPAEKILGTIGFAFRNLALTLEGNLEKIVKNSYAQEKIKQQANFWTLSQISLAFDAIFTTDLRLRQREHNPSMELLALINKLFTLSKRNTLEVKGKNTLT